MIKENLNKLIFILIINFFVSNSYAQDGEDLWNEFTQNQDAQSEGNNNSDSFWSELKQKVNIHGYIENQITDQIYKSYEDDTINFVNYYLRLRLDVNGNIGKNLSYSIDGVGLYYFGDTSLKFKDFIPKVSWDESIENDSRWEIISNQFSYDFPQEFYLDNAFLTINTGLNSSMNFIIGIQQVGQGSAYAWNPTDPFIQKDLMQPNYEQRGAPAIRLKIPFITFGSLDLIASPKTGIENWIFGGRATFRFWRIEMSAVAYTMQEEITDYISSLDLWMPLDGGVSDPEGKVSIDSRRLMLGGDLTLDVAGIRFYCEGAFNFINYRGNDHAMDDWWELSGGLEYYFSFQTHLIIEYFHYGRGNNSSGYSLQDWLRYISGETKQLGTDYLFINIDHPIGDYITVGAIGYMNLTDYSAFMLLQFEWEVFQDCVFSFVGGATIADREDELGSVNGIAWSRLKLFF